jgi:uncharacterized membrane protein YdjX (TVP38/TMEM64 family)
MKRKLFAKLFLIFLFTFILSLLLQSNFNFNAYDIKKWVASFGYNAPIIYSFLLFLGLSVPFNPISDYLVVTLAAFLFSPPVAILATFFSHSLSLSVNYLLSTKFGWPILKRITNKEESLYLKNLSQKITPTKIFGLRWLLPLTGIGIDFVSYAAALAKIPFSKFFLSSIVPWTVLNILFFTTTSYLFNFAPILFFLPALILLSIPIAIYYLFKKEFSSFKRIPISFGEIFKPKL